MNWTRASQEYRLARAHDYSAKREEEERTLTPPHRPKRKKRKSTSSATLKTAGGSKAAVAPAKRKKSADRPQVDAGPERSPEIIRASRRIRARSSGTSTAESIKAEALRRRISVHQVVEERREQFKKPRAGSIANQKRATGLVMSSGREPGKRGSPTSAGTKRKAVSIQPRASLPPKQRRALDEAKRRGMAVEQLLAERRAQGANDQRLRREADALGITVKELRRRRSAAG